MKVEAVTEPVERALIAVTGLGLKAIYRKWEMAGFWSGLGYCQADREGNLRIAVK